MQTQIQILLQLIFAIILGGAIGLEREYKRKEAGLRTYALVCLGAALFTIISFYGFNQFMSEKAVNFDPSRIVGQIVLGVGFIGAGLIIRRGVRVEGLTSAAGLWLTSGIGAAVGAGLYFTAFFTACLAIVILWLARKFEERIIGSKGEEKQA